MERKQDFNNPPRFSRRGFLLFLIFLFCHVYRLHKREVLALSQWLIFEKSEESFPESESARRRHTMLEHLDEVPLGHHRFIISRAQEFLLEFETLALIEWIIEL